MQARSLREDLGGGQRVRPLYLPVFIQWCLIRATLTETLVLFSLNCCLGTSRSCSHQKVRT